MLFLKQNLSIMKKMTVPFLFTFFLALSFIVSSCQKDCASCSIYTINTNVTPDSTENITSPQEYCGEDLDAIDGKSETDSQGIKTEYVCN